MKAHQIIAEIREGRPDAYLELKTYPNTIEDLRDHIDMDGRPSVCWHLIERIDALQGIKLNIGHFVPCVDGVPLEKLPKYTQLDDPDQTKKYHQWHEAKKEVIFEGWEVKDAIGTSTLLEQKTTGQKLAFDKKKRPAIVTPNCLIPIVLIYNLAEATKENPLKLKQ